MLEFSYTDSYMVIFFCATPSLLGLAYPLIRSFEMQVGETLAKLASHY